MSWLSWLSWSLNRSLACDLKDHPLSVIMSAYMKLKGQQELDQFTLTRSEYAKELGITPNAVRMRMRHGGLSGEYRFDGSKYLFRAQSRPRDYQHTDHPQMTTLKKKKINRGNHFKADYPNEAFKLHNEMKMMNKIKSKFKDDAHEKAFNQMNEGALKKSYEQSRPKPATLNTLKNYGSMLNARGLERHAQRTSYEAPRSRSFYIGGMSPDEVKEKGGVYNETRNYYEVGSPVDDGSVEIDLSRSSSRSDLGEPRFDNKIQEAIWRAKNNK